MSRAVQVLDTFSPDAPTQTLKEISQRSALPTSTAHRVVGDLVDNGLLERLADRTYRVGNRLWELGSRTPGAVGLREIAMPYIHGVQARVRQHTQLLIRADLDVLVVDRLSARDAIVNASIIGGRHPLQHSSSGIVLLAFAQDDAVERILERGLKPVTASGIQSRSELVEVLARVRHDGFAVSEGYLHPTSRGIAAPVRGAQDVVVGAIGVVVPNNGSDVAEISVLLRHAAQRISDDLLRCYLPPEHPDARPGGSFRQMVRSSEQSMEFLAHHDGFSQAE
ncbi:IclR family transcriptional regulator [Naasia lichenicola]|uniref:IclR family transcriptional regulator n=1 Tax=Naasia lichenicola TaxID=2565933 RepID=UPI0022B939F3|nr:IclR family transcriptional regulator [Naasia lichenicola]